jgi:hypothetical protein
MTFWRSVGDLIWHIFGPDPVPPPIPPAPPPAPSPPAPPAPVAKAAPRGVTSMGNTGPAIHGTPFVNDCADLVAGMAAQVANVGWNAIEPSPGVYDFSAIDAAKAAAQARGVPIEPRIWAGLYAPADLIALQPVTLPNKQAAKHPNVGLPPTVTFAAYWTPAYRARVRALMAALAARYDADPAVVCIWAMTGTSWTCEPFNIGGTSDVRSALAAAGATDALIEANLSGMVEDMAPWKLTPMGCPIAPLVSVDNPLAAADTVFPLQIAAQLRAAFGARAVLANMGLDQTANPAGGNSECIAAIKAMGGPITYQIDGPTLPQGTNAAYAATMGCTELQEWPITTTAGVPSYTAADVAAWTAALLAN